MNRDKLLEIARDVYGKETTWHGVQVQRLERLAAKILDAFQAPMTMCRCTQECEQGRTCPHREPK